MPENSAQNIYSDQIEKLKYLSEVFCRTGSEYSFSMETLRKKVFYSGLIKSGEFSSVIIPQNFIPYYILLNEDLLNQVECWLKDVSPVPASSVESYFKVKEYFLKWLFAEKEAEIIRYTKAIKDIADQNQDERNFPLNILFILFFLFEGVNKHEVMHLIQNCKRTIEASRTDERVKAMLQYNLTLLSGIYYYRKGDYGSAVIRFSEALNINTHGVTARYFTALAEILMGKQDNALNKIKEIILYDLERLQYIVDHNNRTLFEYFADSPETLNILKDENFAAVSDKIEETINTLIINKRISSQFILKKISELRKLELEDIFSEGISESVHFIETIIASRPEDNSFLSGIIMFYLHEKLLKILRSVSSLIKTNYGKFIERKIERIEGEIIKAGKDIDVLNNNIEVEKNRSGEFVEKALEDLEIYTKGIIQYNLGQLDKINDNRKDSPGKIFSKSMKSGAAISAAAVVVSLIAFLTGSSKPGDSSSAVFNSARLGVFSISASAVFSLIAMFFSNFTKNKERKKLLNKISRQHLVKIEESEKIKKREQDDLNRKVSKFVSEIGVLKERIELLKLDKTRMEEEFRNEAEEQVRMYQKKLFRVMSYEL